MGIRVEPDDYGDDCLTCWPAGKTPKSVFATFSGIQTGDWWRSNYPPPPNGPFKLNQVDGYPCIFSYFGTIWTVIYSAKTNFPPGTQSSLIIDCIPLGAASTFAQLLDGTCHYSFENNTTLPAGNFFYEGAGWVFELTK